MIAYLPEIISIRIIYFPYSDTGIFELIFAQIYPLK